jgi:hypothetical protein
MCLIWRLAVFECFRSRFFEGCPPWPPPVRSERYVNFLLYYMEFHREVRGLIVITSAMCHIMVSDVK